MIWIALLLTIFVLAALLRALHRPDTLEDRFISEMGYHRGALKRLDDERDSAHLSAAEAQALKLDVQRRMLRLHRPMMQKPTLMRAYWAYGFCGLSLALACVGYGLSGNYKLPDAPLALKPSPPATLQALGTARRDLLQDPANVAAWIDMSFALQKQGQGVRAIEALEVATRAMPKSADLWVARGQALIAHGGGQISPAARLAFDRAAALDPKHPGPRLYLALAWLQAGSPQQALPLLQSLARESPPAAAWMPQVQRMMRGADAMIAAGIGSSMAPR